MNVQVNPACKPKDPAQRFKHSPFAYSRREGGPWYKWTPNNIKDAWSLVWDDGTVWNQRDLFNAEAFLPDRVELIHRFLHPECEE
jgi:hypothetical protein